MEIIMDIKDELLKFNAFINVVYERLIKLSDILSEYSFSKDEIEFLKKEAIEKLLNNINFALQCKFVCTSNKLRLYQIIRRRYGLFGYNKSTLREIAVDMGISHERVRQLEEKAIRYLKPNKRGDFLSMAITVSACQALNTDITTKLLQTDTEEL